jgi:hypothetical protein
MKVDSQERQGYRLITPMSQDIMTEAVMDRRRLGEITSGKPRRSPVNNKKAIPIISCLIFSAICAPERQRKPVEMLFSDNQDVVKRGIVTLYKMGKSAIPLLIDAIGDQNPLRVFLESPRNSTIDTSRPRGIFAAYIVEWILAIGNPDLGGLLKSPYLLGNELSNYIYTPRLMKDGRDVSVADLLTIRRFYREWWERNSSKDLNELRSAWKQNIKPLTESPYSWR